MHENAIASAKAFMNIPSDDTVLSKKAENWSRCPTCYIMNNENITTKSDTVETVIEISFQIYLEFLECIKCSV